MAEFIFLMEQFLPFISVEYYTNGVISPFGHYLFLAIYLITKLNNIPLF